MRDCFVEVWNDRFKKYTYYRYIIGIIMDLFWKKRKRSRTCRWIVLCPCVCLCVSFMSQERCLVFIVMTQRSGALSASPAAFIHQSQSAVGCGRLITLQSCLIDVGKTKGRRKQHGCRLPVAAATGCATSCLDARLADVLAKHANHWPTSSSTPFKVFDFISF